MPRTAHGTPYAAGSDTSYAAALQARAFVSTQGLAVWRWLRTQAKGGTRKDAEAALGIKPQSLCARLKALEEAGAITKTEARRDGCVVYRATDRERPTQIRLL